MSPRRVVRPLSRDFVEQFLLGGGYEQRFTQDGPVLPEVWMAFACSVARRVPLLISPFKEIPAGTVARELLGSYADPEPGRLDLRDRKNHTRSVQPEARVAYLDQVVAANLTFEEMITIAAPNTDWWIAHARDAARRERYLLDRKVLIRSAIAELIDDPERPKPIVDIPDPVSRFVTVTGLLLVRGDFGLIDEKDAMEEMLNHASGRRRVIERMVEALSDSRFTWDVLSGYPDLNEYTAHDCGSIYSISLNRTAFPAISRSVGAIKADAAKQLFSPDCRRLTWAIIDSGVDGTHPAFLGDNGERRVRATYDFTRVRDLLWFDRLTSDEDREELISEFTDFTGLPKAQVKTLVETIAADVVAANKVNWAIVRKLLQCARDMPPYSDHGTHVASILAGKPWDGHDKLTGVCPDLNLYDLRVLGQTLEETEFAVIAALQFVRQLNERGAKVIHGANLSLSIPHDVRNYACGRTPVCEEAERLTSSGVTVVAAAGNFGYQEYHTSKGLFPGYCAISITDPGNAENVITVGSTHRYRPHTYGVSYFSSRGPTGDGRIKPDIVAPGEKIEAALPNGESGIKDGTSMAAPHVSGAAAMLMARYDELVDDPKTIKRLLLESASDLGRERYFQGEGMLDVLRAMQKV